MTVGDRPPDLLLVAHGTRSAHGTETTRALAEAVAAQRPDVRVRLCFLDVGDPTLDAALAQTQVRTVLLPALLSTGYHVLTDIPGALAGRPDVRVARHLGPDPLLATALADRLAEAGGPADASTLLVAAGSSRSEAATELAEAAKLLSSRLGVPVATATLADDVAAVLAAQQPPVRVATYLLSAGRFYDQLRDAVHASAARDVTTVSAPIGAHPALVELVWARYDQTEDENGQRVGD
jgi:sirohydrochlorin ferrochelatase